MDGHVDGRTGGWADRWLGEQMNGGGGGGGDRWPMEHKQSVYKIK